MFSVEESTVPGTVIADPSRDGVSSLVCDNAAI